MKLCIVIQSDAFRTSAGMRIRYDRFRECLPDPSVSLDSLTVAELAAAASLDHDVYIFCKTFTTEALIQARRLRAAGKTVGQDLFDDYFSQYADPRLERFRDWLRDMVPVTQFAICSTLRMVEVLEPYLPGIRIVAIDDPIIGFDPSTVAARADTNVARARDSRTLDVVWFGIGDNPYFPVGLSDLGSCADVLARIERLGFQVRLRIVTNRRAFEDGGAELLRPLSVDYEIVEWSEDVERDELARAAVALLPVSGQSFSCAKSTNRAVTALSSGCQVLSVGYPLYERLDAHIYRSADELVADIERNSCRVGATQIDALNATLTTLANPFEAAASFVREARAAMKLGSHAKDAPLLCLIHGRQSTIGLHKMASGVRGVSVGTPFNGSAWNFQVRFDIVDRRLAMRAHVALARRLDLPVADAAATVRIRDLEFVEVDLAALGMAPLTLHLPVERRPIDDLAIYEDVMRYARDCCRAAFAPVDVLIRDTAPIARRVRDVAAPRGVPRRRRKAGPAVVGSVPRVLDERAEMARPARTSPLAAAPKRSRFVLGGAAKKRQREVALIASSRLFDRDWYVEHYRDVAGGDVDPAQHYLAHGWREGRDPGPHFSSKLYLKAHRDVAGQDINPLLHFIEYGEAEGRRIADSLHRAMATSAK